MFYSFQFLKLLRGFAVIGLLGVATSGVSAATIPPLFWPASGGTVDLGFGANWILKGCDRLPQAHAGIDIKVARLTNVYAAQGGVVKFVGGTRFVRGSQFVVIEHRDNQGRRYTTNYWHVIPVVRWGQSVARGQLIAGVDGLPGNDHFHFGVRNQSYGLISNNLALPRTRKCTPLLPKFPEKFKDPLLYFTPPTGN